MTIYEKAKEFFGALSGAYSKLSTYKNLAEQHTRQINEISRLLGQVSGLEKYIDETAEQRTILSEELATTQKQLTTTQAKLLDYQKGATETPEYKDLLGKNNALETRVEGLEEQVFDLNNLCLLRQETIKKQRDAFRDYFKRHREIIEGFLQKKAEHDDQEMSYVVVDGDDNIIASTPIFRDNFYHHDIERIKYKAVLKSPEIDGKVQNWINLEGFLKSQKQEDLVATIVDGRKKNRRVILEKQKPDVFQCLEYDDEGKPVTFSLVYRRIDIHDVGRLESHKREKRTDQAGRLNDYAAILKLNEIEIVNAELKKATDYYYNSHLKDRLTFRQAVKVWEDLGKKQRTYQNWRKGCYKLIVKQRRGNRKNQAKEQKKQESE